jgi:hypothetical protein
MKPMLDLSAPIVPARGLGGLEIGRNVVAYGQLLSEAIGVDPLEDAVVEWKYIFSLYEARYRLTQVYEMTDEEFDRMLDENEERFRRIDQGESPENLDLWVPDQPEPGPPAVEVCVDIRDGTVFALHALEGYKGQLFDKVRTGMTGGEAMKAEPRFELHWDGLRVEGIDGLRVGLSFSGAEADLEPEQAEVATVNEIWVYDPKRSDDGVLPISPAEIDEARA